MTTGAPPIGKGAAARMVRQWPAGRGADAAAGAQSPGGWDGWVEPSRRRIAVAAFAAACLGICILAPRAQHAGADGGLLPLRPNDGQEVPMNALKTSVMAVATLAPMMLDTGAMGQAVQWRVQDGGNGHWYGFNLTPLWWNEANAWAVAHGGYLASITSDAEQAFIEQIDWVPYFQRHPWAAWLGATKRGCSWRWGTNETWGFTRWAPGDPNSGCLDAQLTIYVRLSEQKFSLRWDDCVCPPDGAPFGSLVEWSADCNNDGVVDYGQIAAGLLIDSDGDYTPDCCESATNCCTGDVLIDLRVDGADLAAILSHWGPVTANPVSVACDLDRSGTVDGNDLGMLLAHWGPCGG